jgi:hypothetical protein
MRERFGCFWSAGVWQQIAVIVGALLLCGCCGLVVAGGGLAAVNLFVPVHGSTTIGFSTVVVLETSTPAATQPASGGPPRLGAPLADFTAAYGPIVSHGSGGSDNFYADKARTTIVTVTFMGDAADMISVSGPTSWTTTQTMNYCTMFLPAGASEYDQAPPNTDYHSPLGNFILKIVGPGKCVLFFTIL